jgi:hypothetical protein
MAAGERIHDPGFLEQAFQDLVNTGTEFPIRVEGAKTLPYTAVLLQSDPGGRTLLVKLFRPLPPALAAGAAFDLVFSALGKRYEGRFALLGREGYLRYEFQWPTALVSSDRRIWKRYPFRPREQVFVTAQDSEIPCHGITGPLTNLSQGGCLFRVDRMIRLDDGLPVPPRSSLFIEGRPLSFLRIHGLTRTTPLDARAQVVRALEEDSQVHLALSFHGLDDATRNLLERVLGARERKAASGAVALPGAHPDAHGDADPEPDEVAAGAPNLEAAGAETLDRLRRRTTRVLVVAPEGAERAGLVQHLQANGFWRLDLEPDLFTAHARHKAEPLAHRLLVVDLEPSLREGLEAVGAVRHMETLLRSFGTLPVAFCTRAADPMLELLDKPNLGALATEATDAGASLRVLDRLLGLA